MNEKNSMSTLWKRLFSYVLIGIFLLLSCKKSVSETPTDTHILKTHETETVTPSQTNTPNFTHTLIPTSHTPTLAPDTEERPIFLVWPLPTHIGTARIFQYPNTPWTWNYLGLNEGYQCPPMFGYLLNLDSLPYWRDASIPEEQDKAQADPHQFEMVECYSTDGNVGANGHGGTDIKAPAGTPVLAVADGKIQEWRLTGLNSMIVLKHCLGGTWDVSHQCTGGKQWYTTYMHIIPDVTLLQENQDIVRGQQLGTIYDQAINSHLHFEVGLEKRSYTNFVNPWGDDNPPWLGCMWLDQSICVNPDPAYKRMALQNDTQIILLQGNVEPIKIEIQGIKRIFLWGDRIGLLDTEGNLLIRDGKYDGGSLTDNLSKWKLVAENVLGFQLAGNRIAILDQDRNLFLLNTDFDDSWVFQANTVVSYSLSTHRIGFLTDNGDLFVKEDNDDWILISSNVLGFQVIDNRVAFVDQQGTLYVNEGKLLSKYEQMANDVIAFQVTNVRIGIIDTDYDFLVKEGNLRANWILLAEDVQTFQLADYRILTKGKDNAFKLMEGNLYQKWGDLPDGNWQDMVLNGGLPVFVDLH